jgi:hypothetical protein
MTVSVPLESSHDDFGFRDSCFGTAVREGGMQRCAVSRGY